MNTFSNTSDVASPPTKQAVHLSVWSCSGVRRVATPTVLSKSVIIGFGQFSTRAKCCYQKCHARQPNVESLSSPVNSSPFHDINNNPSTMSLVGSLKGDMPQQVRSLVSNARILQSRRQPPNTGNCALQTACIRFSEENAIIAQHRVERNLALDWHIFI